MFEQDYILRQIREISKLLANLTLKAEVNSIAAELPQETREKVDDLVNKVKNGKAQEAVDELDRISDDNTKENLLLGLEFYSRLSDMDEIIFQSAAYSLIRAKKDFERFAEKFGMQQMTNLYFGDDDE